jgi:hypothetical protein
MLWLRKKRPSQAPNRPALFEQAGRPNGERPFSAHNSRVWNDIVRALEGTKK